MKTKLYKRNQNNTIGFVEIITRKEIGKEKEFTITTNKGILGSNKFSTIKKKLNIKNKSINDVFDKLIVDQCNQGYNTSLESVKENTYNTFSDGSLMPMLLNKINMAKVTYPCYVQRKYDGMRCLSELKNSSLHLKSRENNAITIAHISNSVNKIYNEQLREQFDGEIYLHNKDLGDMISIYKNGDTEQQLTYVIYDVPNCELSFEHRRNMLMSLCVDDIPNVKVDCGVEINNEEELMSFYNEILKDGYEGAVVCDPESLYTPGYRSNGKTKVKPNDTDEFKCVGHYFNKGKMAKQSTLVCETKDGRSFHVKMKGTSEQREKYAVEFENKFLNKMVTVEFRKISKYGVPIEARGICVRDYE